MAETITQAQYRALQHAYEFFNKELFAGKLPNVLVTLQRHAKAKGYFSPNQFTGRSESSTAHELAMNPDSFTGRTDEEILSTLTHEMAHVWQQAHGTPPRRSYHDRQWAAKMKEIGLQPSTTGEPGGKETGQSVTHYILPGGPNAKAYAVLLFRWNRWFRNTTIVVVPEFRSFVSCAAWKREIEGRPLSQLRLDPDAATIALDHALTDRKTNAGTRNRAPVKPLKHAENLQMIFRFDSNAVVGHRETPFGLSILGRDMNAGRLRSAVL